VEFSIKSGNPAKQRTGCLVAGIFEPRKMSLPAELLDKASDGLISSLLRRGDMEGRSGSSLLLHKPPGIKAERLLLVGLGKEREFRENEYRNAIATAIRAISQTGSADATLCLESLPVKKRDLPWCIRQAVLLAEESLYRFEQMKSKKDEVPRPLARLGFCVPDRVDLASAEQALKEGEAIASGMSFMKNLANLPGNLCTPSYLAVQAQEMAGEFGLEVEVLGRTEIESLGMHTLLAVAQGSRQPPQLIVLQYHGGKKEEKPVVLIGKGVTFDTGGISLKPPAEMDEMKFDMSGAASVLAALRAAARLKLPLNIVAIVPAVENMPGGEATRPGDIVTSMSGQTVEILNTDAEGRLILCDAMTYAERFKPDCVIDVATLTGACVIALGHVLSGLLANDEKLARELLDAGHASWDRAWQMPLFDDYQEQLKSNFADMANIGGRAAGTITAAAFLSRFARKYDWAHLDIAGTSYKSGKEKGSTGRPVPLLVSFLLARAAKKARVSR